MVLNSLKMKKLLIVGVLALSVVACKNKEAEPEVPAGPTQMESVVAVHDELMPKMGEIGQLIAKLEANIDSTNVDSVKVKAVMDLKDANQSMMQWMRDFGTSFESDEIMKGAPLSEEKQKSLDTFEASVNALKAEMESAMENGAAALEHQQ